MSKAVGSPGVAWTRIWMVAFACATVIGMVTAAPDLLNPSRDQGSKALPWTTALPQVLLPWYGWALLAPLVVDIVRRVPPGTRPHVRNISLHIAAAVVLCMAKLILLTPAASVLFQWNALGVTLGDGIAWLMIHRLPSNLVMYGMLVAAATAYTARGLAHERQMATAELRTALSEAELRALRAQLDPHFLFNALNALNALIRTDPRTAEMLVESLSDLLRLVLRMASEAEVTLRDELLLVERYAQVQRLRLGGRLHLESQVPPELLDARVPSIVLQPLIENAINHGTSRDGTIRIRVVAAIVGGHLELTVANSHCGGRAQQTTPAARSTGIGLTNMRARLRSIHGDRARVDLVHGHGETLATVVLPLSAP